MAWHKGSGVGGHVGTYLRGKDAISGGNISVPPLFMYFFGSLKGTGGMAWHSIRVHYWRGKLGGHVGTF